MLFIKCAEQAGRLAWAPKASGEGLQKLQIAPSDGQSIPRTLEAASEQSLAPSVRSSQRSIFRADDKRLEARVGCVLLCAGRVKLQEPGQVVPRILKVIDATHSSGWATG